MPRYWVMYATDDGESDSVFVEAENKHAAADKVMDDYDADEILEVEEQ